MVCIYELEGSDEAERQGIFKLRLDEQASPSQLQVHMIKGSSGDPGQVYYVIGPRSELTRDACSGGAKRLSTAESRKQP
jgi:hypothetical protein